MYQYESELWINADGKQERLEEGSAYVDKIYSELSVNYPKALDCLMSMYKEAIRKGEDFVYYANKHARKHFESRINKVDILVERMKNNSNSAIE